MTLSAAGVSAQNKSHATSFYGRFFFHGLYKNLQHVYRLEESPIHMHGLGLVIGFDEDFGKSVSNPTHVKRV